MSQQRMRKRFPPWASEFVNRSKRVKRKLQTDLLDAAKCRIKLNYEYNKKDDELRFYIDIVDPRGYPIIESANVCKGTKPGYNDAVSKEDLETKVNAQKSMLAGTADDATIDYTVAVHPNKQSNPANYTPDRAVEIIFSIHKDKSGIITSTVDHLLVGCWSCGGSHLINPISKQHLGTILLLAYTLICGRKINAAGSGKLIDATGGYYNKFGWLGDDEELTLKKPGTKGLVKMKNVLLGSIYRNGPGKYLKKGIDDEDVEDLLKSIKGLDRWSMAVMRGGIKTKRRKKRICCVGIGCPEWKHCLHVLGDGAKYRPKRKSTLKRMKKCLTRHAKTYKKCMKRERKKSHRRKKRKKNRKRRTRKKRGGAIEMIPTPTNVEELGDILKNEGIYTIDWGKSKKTKPLSKLFEEVENGETKLANINGKIKRIVDTVSVKIYDNPQKAYLLWEEGHYNEKKEKLKDRGNTDVREKMNEGENPREAVKRGIAEELGENYSTNIRFFKGSPVIDIDKVDIKEEDSHSYPGLPARYRWYRDEAFIPNLTSDTLYPPPGKKQETQYWHKELKDDGTFKRWIKWEWKKT